MRAEFRINNSFTNSVEGTLEEVVDAFVQRLVLMEGLDAAAVSKRLSDHYSSAKPLLDVRHTVIIESEIDTYGRFTPLPDKPLRNPRMSDIWRMEKVADVRGIEIEWADPRKGEPYRVMVQNDPDLIVKWTRWKYSK